MNDKESHVGLCNRCGAVLALFVKDAAFMLITGGVMVRHHCTKDRDVTPWTEPVTWTHFGGTTVTCDAVIIWNERDV